MSLMMRSADGSECAVIPGRGKAANPESIFTKVAEQFLGFAETADVMDSGFRPSAGPGMTSLRRVGGQRVDNAVDDFLDQ
jgi:hypothetical protein